MKKKKFQNFGTFLFKNRHIGFWSHQNATFMPPIERAHPKIVEFMVFESSGYFFPVENKARKTTRKLKSPVLNGLTNKNSDLFFSFVIFRVLLF